MAFGFASELDHHLLGCFLTLHHSALPSILLPICTVSHLHGNGTPCSAIIISHFPARITKLPASCCSTGSDFFTTFQRSLAPTSELFAVLRLHARSLRRHLQYPREEHHLGASQGGRGPERFLDGGHRRAAWKTAVNPHHPPTTKICAQSSRRQRRARSTLWISEHSLAGRELPIRTGPTHRKRAWRDATATPRA